MLNIFGGGSSLRFLSHTSQGIRRSLSFGQDSLADVVRWVWQSSGADPSVREHQGKHRQSYRGCLGTSCGCCAQPRLHNAHHVQSRRRRHQWQTLAAAIRQFSWHRLLLRPPALQVHIKCFRSNCSPLRSLRTHTNTREFEPKTPNADSTKLLLAIAEAMIQIRFCFRNHFSILFGSALRYQLIWMNRWHHNSSENLFYTILAGGRAIHSTFTKYRSRLFRDSVFFFEICSEWNWHSLDVEQRSLP